MRGLWLVGAAVAVIGAILIAMPPDGEGSRIVHEGAFILTPDSNPIVTLRLEEGDYELWLQDVDGWQRENEFVGLDVVDGSMRPLELEKDTGYTLKLVDNITIERHSVFSVEREQRYTIMAYTWDDSHVADDDHIYVKRLASDAPNAFLPVGIACLVVGIALVLTNIYMFKRG